VHQLSLAQLTINNATAPELIAAAAEAGFDAVGLRVVSPAGVGAHPPLAGDAVRLREAVRALRASGLAALQVNSFWIVPGTTRETFLPVLEAAVELGAGHVLAVIDEPNLPRGIAVLADCAAAAAPAGIKLALEFQPYGAVKNLHQASDIVGRFGNAGVVVDALHLYRSGGTAAEVAALPPGRLAFVQFCDAPRRVPPMEELRVEARGRRLYPGDGELPLPALLEALPAGTVLDLEIPCERTMHLPFAQQARLAADATRRLLAACEAARRQP
jgi:sugar phosphate isomerase/epimerase